MGDVRHQAFAQPFLPGQGTPQLLNPAGQHIHLTDPAGGLRLQIVLPTADAPRPFRGPNHGPAQASGDDVAQPAGHDDHGRSAHEGIQGHTGDELPFQAAGRRASVRVQGPNPPPLQAQRDENAVFPPHSASPSVPHGQDPVSAGV